MKAYLIGFLTLAPVPLCLAAAGVAAPPAGADQPLYKRAEAPVGTRVADLLKRMTLSEKLKQMTGYWPEDEAGVTASGELFTPEFLKKQFGEGIGTVGPINLSLKEDVRFRNTVQTFLRDKTRLGIPAIFHDEGCHGVMKDQATSFPMPIGLACSWDEQLFEEVYDVVGREMRARGGHQALTPILDVARDPRWGRIEEMLGEDPYLNGRLGAAVVRGLQGGATGHIDRQHVMSTLKHFVGHGTPEGGLNHSPLNCGVRELREVHIAPFEYVVRTVHPAAVMPSYNDVDGVPSHANRWLLGDVLRNELQFRGLIVSDYFGIDRLATAQHVAANSAAAGRLALEAGVQMELPLPGGFAQLSEAIRTGHVKQQFIDEAVRAILTAKFRLGLFDDPLVDPDKAWQLANRAESRQLARRAAQESIVMLKNDGGLLPLSVDKYPKIAVIGPHADIARLGGYSGTPLSSVSVLDGIRKRVAGKAEVLHAQGCVVVKNDARNAYRNWKYVNVLQFATPEENRPRIAEAQRVAAGADVVVLVLGDSECTCREAWAPTHLGDRASLELIGSQMDLARAVLATGKPVVVYLMNGRPATIGELKDHAPAILEGWYMGEETGTAAADILFGDVSPSGKLTVTFPKTVGHLPAYYGKRSAAAEFNYLQSDNEPLFPFGYGLSYATFKYGNLRLKDEKIPTDGATSVSVEVTNAGHRAAAEIVQLYTRQEATSVTRPVKELKGFRRVWLQPGETKTVTFPLAAAALAFYDIELKRRTEPGTVQVMVGPSSRELSTVRLQVEAGAGRAKE